VFRREVEVHLRGEGKSSLFSMSNDLEFGALVKTQAAAMTVPKLKLLREQSAEMLGRWGQVLEQTRELTAVRTQIIDGKTVLADYGVYQEDATGGFFTLHSGAAITDANGQTIARATLEDVLGQQGFTLTQTFSPSSRGTATQFRAEVPYLTKIVEGRVVILDHGVKRADGSWTLASNPTVSFATAQDILNQPHATGTAWITEEIGFNPYADIPVEKIGIYFLDGKAIDYTVEVTDDRGAFYVWARNLDYAMELQQLQGNARGYNLRSFEVEFFGLDEVGSSDNSKVRVELLTPGQFHFATQLFGVAFRPQMLSATYANTTGQLRYTIIHTGQYRTDSLDGTQQSDIKTILNLLDNVMDAYVTASRAFAARIALQGGANDNLQARLAKNNLRLSLLVT
jgi:hypothetical protein